MRLLDNIGETKAESNRRRYWLFSFRSLSSILPYSATGNKIRTRWTTPDWFTTLFRSTTGCFSSIINANQTAANKFWGINSTTRQLHYSQIDCFLTHQSLTEIDALIGLILSNDHQSPGRSLWGILEQHLQLRTQQFGWSESGGGFAEPQNITRLRLDLWKIFDRSLVASLFPIAYATVLLLLLVKAFRSMRSANLLQPSSRLKSRDRTGLRTIHPELLDENGNVTEEELFVIRFSDKR